MSQAKPKIGHIAWTDLTVKSAAKVSDLYAAVVGWKIPEVDMDETNLPLECGIEARAVSYQKGCYIGQEVINRIHSIGHVNRELRGLRLAEEPKTLPAKGDKLFHAGKEGGHVTSALHAPTLNAPLALGYVRREANAVGTELQLRTGDGERGATILALPFAKKAGGFTLFPPFA